MKFHIGQIFPTPCYIILGPDVFLNTTFSNTHHLCSARRVRGQFSQEYQNQSC